eukprot:g15680.t1
MVLMLLFKLKPRSTNVDQGMWVRVREEISYDKQRKRWKTASGEDNHTENIKLLEEGVDTRSLPTDELERVKTLLAQTPLSSPCNGGIHDPGKRRIKRLRTNVDATNTGLQHCAALATRVQR